MFYRSRNKSSARPGNNHNKNQAPTSTGALEKTSKNIKLTLYLSYQSYKRYTYI